MYHIFNITDNFMCIFVYFQCFYFFTILQWIHYCYDVETINDYGKNIYYLLYFKNKES